MGYSLTQHIIGIIITFLMVVGQNAMALEPSPLSKEVYRGAIDEALLRLDRLPKTDRNQALNATLLMSKGQYNEARFILNTIVTPPRYQPIIAYQKVKVNLLLNDEAAAIAAIRELRNRVDTQFFIRKAELALAAFYYKQNRRTQADTIIQKFRRMGMDPIVEPAILELDIQEALARKDQKTVTKRYGDLIKKYPTYDTNGYLWDEIKATFLNKIQLSDCFEFPGEYLDYLKSLYDAGLFEMVIRQGNAMLEMYPSYSKSANVYLILAKTYMQRYQFSFALNYLRKASVFDPSLSAKINYYRATTLWYANQYTEAVRYFERALQENSESEIQASATFYLAVYHHQFGPQKKYLAYKEALEKMTPSYYADKLNWLIRYEALRQNDAIGYFTQEAEYTALFRNKKIGKDVLAFVMDQPTDPKWLGRSPAEKYRYAINAFPLSFFATKVLDTIHLANKKEIEDPVIQDQERFLYEAGLGDLALEYLAYKESARSASESEIYRTRVWLNFSMHRYDKVLDNTRGDVHDLFFRKPISDPGLYRVVYPQLHRELVDYYADKYAIQPAWLYALMKHASHFDPFYNEGERKGVFGMKPEVARQLAYQIGFYWKHNVTAYDVEKSIHIAAYYLSYLNKKFNGNMVKIITGFYEGEQTVLAWMPKEETDSTPFMRHIRVPLMQLTVQYTLDSILVYTFLYHSDHSADFSGVQNTRQRVAHGF